MLDYDDDYDIDPESDEDDFYNDYDGGWMDDNDNDEIDDISDIAYDTIYVPSRIETLRFAFYRYIVYPFRHAILGRIRRCAVCKKSRRNCECIPW